MSELPVDLVRDAFGLRGRLLANTRMGSRHWRLTTERDDVFVKLVDPDGHADELWHGFEFERRAYEAGLSMPEPLTARGEPAVRLGADRVLTAHRWTAGRELSDTDDIGTWLGITLARMAALEPAAAADAFCYRFIHEGPSWRDLAERGRRADQPWHEVLKDRLDLIADQQRRITEVVEGTGRYARCHPDVEPWNVLVTDGGPVLCDWTFAVPDAVDLVVAHAALSFAARAHRPPDRERLRRTVQAYRHAGGAPLGPTPGLLSRRLALMLSRLHERLRASLGDDVDLDPTEATRTATTRLRDLPTYIAELHRWETWLPTD